jgi:hypothetical protein
VKAIAMRVSSPHSKYSLIVMPAKAGIQRAVDGFPLSRE